MGEKVRIGFFWVLILAVFIAFTMTACSDGYQNHEGCRDAGALEGVTISVSGKYETFVYKTSKGTYFTISSLAANNSEQLKTCKEFNGMMNLCSNHHCVTLE
jgi:hypothetical protein